MHLQSIASIYMYINRPWGVWRTVGQTSHVIEVWKQLVTTEIAPYFALFDTHIYCIFEWDRQNLISVFKKQHITDNMRVQPIQSSHIHVKIQLPYLGTVSLLQHIENTLVVISV